MAQPSSSHREHDERRHRSSSSSRHHRTISSTTLLLVLSLVLAVLAVMLSLPSNGLPTSGGTEGSNASVWKYLTPKRSQELVARESAVAAREAEVARREAELLVGAPGGVLPSPPAPVVCPACTTSTTVETIYAPAQTVIKEVVKEDSLTPPGWHNSRAEEILDRELKVAERERDISKREEGVNRREHDASRRESWIMEQLIALGNDNPAVEEEYIYETPSKRRPKYQELPPLVISETQFETETKTLIQTQTITVPAPANTRLAAQAAPQFVDSSTTYSIPKTTAVVEIITEEDEEETPVQVMRSRPTRMPPSRWFGGW